MHHQYSLHLGKQYGCSTHFLIFVPKKPKENFKNSVKCSRNYQGKLTYLYQSSKQQGNANHINN